MVKKISTKKKNQRKNFSAKKNKTDKKNKNKDSLGGIMNKAKTLYLNEVCYI